MKFLTGKDYGHLCERCRSAIDGSANIILAIQEFGPDSLDFDNIELPFDYTADHGLLCGGRTCAGGFEPGQVCIWKGRYYTAVVILESFHRRGGFWLARDRDGSEVCPDADDLDLVTEESTIAFRHEAYVMQMRKEVQDGLHT